MTKKLMTPSTELVQENHVQSVHEILNSEAFAGVDSEAKSELLKRILTQFQESKNEITSVNFLDFQAFEGDTSIKEALDLLSKKTLVPREVEEIIMARIVELELSILRGGQKAVIQKPMTLSSAMQAIQAQYELDMQVEPNGASQEY